MCILGLSVVLVAVTAALRVHQNKSHSAYAAQIQNVIALDRQALKACSGNRGEWDDIVDPSNGIRQYVAAIRTLNLSNCPKGFVDAYVRYIQSCEKLILELDNKAGIRGMFLPMLNGALGGDVSAAVSIDQDVVRCREEVLSSWHEVEHIARTYGVNMSG